MALNIEYTSVNTLTIPSARENISMVEPYIDEVREKYGFGEEIYGNILISMTEAVNNAIIHGNQCDQSKNVVIICEPSSDQGILSFKIIDEGPGFDYNNLPDPTSPENLLKVTGRGVFLMKQLSDWIIFGDNGSTIEMRFKI